ncbi:guanylate kinase [Candidatus Gracilibacteria bacterium]|nr:guanylate kinase [Candidatus Gracilibacteria bacterium]
MNKGHIYFIMGVSGAGKGTLINALKDTNLDLHIPLSYKTRKKRDFEIDGKDAHFISLDEFKKSIENNEFLEYAIVHDKDYYGTKYDDVILNGIDLGKIVIKELDVLGLKRLIKDKPELKDFYTTIFLNIPVNKLRDRIKKRGEEIKEEELLRREQSAIMEEKEARLLCDYMLDATQSPDKVLKEILDIIN